MVATFSTAVIVKGSFAAEPYEPLGGLNEVRPPRPQGDPTPDPRPAGLFMRQRRSDSIAVALWTRSRRPPECDRLPPRVCIRLHPQAGRRFHVCLEAAVRV